MNQRGSLLMYALLGLAVASVIGTAVYKVKQWGADEVRIEWAEANRLAAVEAEKLRLAREAEGKKIAAAQQESDRKARDYEAKWRQARNALRDVPLAIPSCPLPSPAGAPAGLPDKPMGGLRLTYGFVRLYDAGWTGKDGKPVFIDSGEPANWPERADTAEGVGLEGLLENAQINASRCSEDRRNYGALVDLIKKLRQN